MNLANAEIIESYITVRRSSRSHFPKTEGFGFIDFLLGNLRELLNSEVDYFVSVKHQIHVVHEEIEFLRSFLRDIEEQYKEHQDLKTLDSSIMEVMLEAEYLIDVFILGDCLQWYHPIWLSDLIEDLKLIKLQATEICENAHGININYVPTLSRNVISPPKIPKIDEVVIDLADEKKLVIDRLIAGSPQLDVVSIVGMAGLGKTTLALKVYTDPSVTYHFHIRAWCCVSQAYQKRELLLEILGDIVELTDHILEMSDGDLEMKLYQCLKRNRFLIVMDDIWSTSAWYDFQGSFPNDNNGSRILITSRLPDVARKMKVDSVPHPLRLLSNDESWKLLQRRVFDTKECPDELMAFGNQIAESYKGLPLAVVAISGLLERTDKIPDWWKQVSESICSHIADDVETRCIHILELSYRCLPDHLKHCFLYTGVFLEYKDIPIRKLTWLWLAEGFIWNTDQENNEDVAEGDLYPRCPYDISFIFDKFKLLRVLDLECINMGNSFPTGVQLLIQLRYLALSGDIDCIPASISHLRDLETLLVKGLRGTENIMRRLLKLRKLRCVFSELRDDTGKLNQFPVLNFLTELESLNVLYSGRISLPCEFDFPLNLKKLTLSKFRLPWDCISQIGRLPNLEVLKSLSRAFEGKVWEMKEGEFPKLKFLKLDNLNIAQWNASSDHLPQLQHLILRSCRQLEEIPSAFCESSTLEMIEVQLCTSSVEESVIKLKEELLEMGNEDFKVLIDRSDMDL
ncbi:putative late blight resistance protein homolog R1B-17 [Coffea arabica]|uniref:Late blight resistance protein homolog R1B-17 n=1 Tax=Coffea arabica TaxID=13443 RepID=A0A6P6UZV7_COFAR|nr:putative late blight resistance protein homolog R1A-4 [Coffea arabica]